MEFGLDIQFFCAIFESLYILLECLNLKPITGRQPYTKTQPNWLPKQCHELSPDFEFFKVSCLHYWGIQTLKLLKNCFRFKRSKSMSTTNQIVAQFKSSDFVNKNVESF